jgi:dye decolorizing peroxidase
MTEQTPDPPQAGIVSRRRLLLGTGAGVVALGVGGYALGRADTAPIDDAADTTSPAPTAAIETAIGTPISAVGIHQAGVTTPAVPQSHCLVAIADVDRSALSASLAALGEAVGALTDSADPVLEVTPDGPGDLTVTVGVGPDALASTRRPDLAALATLPQFAGDAELTADRRGGDLYISVNASDPLILEPVLAHLQRQVAGFRLRWSDLGFRTHVDAGVTRNPFGYHDGVIVPRTDAELAADVWIGSGPLTGGAIVVIRRFQLDTSAFRALPAAQQDATIGRRRVDGAPLSGGGLTDQIDVDAKADNGDLLVPARAHARAAHPSFTGSALMLRRSYSFRNSPTDAGHLFISFQNDVATFARTQLRLDDVDDLMQFVTPTATAAFVILPGMQSPSGARQALGAPLFG